KLGYLAPEVIVSQPADRRIDVFGAGIILWEALSGRRLFQGKDDAETVQNVVRLPIEPASTFNNSVPPEVDALLAQCLERNPNRRLQDADSLANEIDRILQRIDPDVSSKDVSLLVGLHLAGNREEHKPLTSFELLANELDAFVNNGEQRNAGAEPLDPSAFASAPRPGYSVVRPLPTGDDDEWFSD
ncbi:MAG: protein kinase, partial [Myxococcota bacterium]